MGFRTGSWKCKLVQEWLNQLRTVGSSVKLRFDTRRALREEESLSVGQLFSNGTKYSTILFVHRLTPCSRDLQRLDHSTVRTLSKSWCTVHSRPISCLPEDIVMTVCHSCCPLCIHWRSYNHPPTCCYSWFHFAKISSQLTILQYLQTSLAVVKSEC